jgi:N-acetyl-alpha-D-glucosaminyl L-malate synthase BshA
MNIGIICYASVGGSGIIATELGKQLAVRGHRVHILSTDTPVRLGEFVPGLVFHRVETPNYPLFREPHYLLSLANKIVEVARTESLDVVHAHYAIPHAAAAYLARQILASRHVPAPAVITTLHGTDITLLGSDRSYSEIVRFGIEASDGVTAVSHSLKNDTCRDLDVTCDIQVIPNFIDLESHRKMDSTAIRRRFAPAGEKVVIHVSNFRPVKRVTAVIEVFARVRALVPCRLLMVGDGPDLSEAVSLAQKLRLGDAVQFLGEQDRVVPLLSASDVFVLPSAQESFGLAALEAMACEVPVVASRVGGLPEVVDHGLTGFLHRPDDLDGMAQSVARLLTDAGMQRAFGVAARRSATDRYSDSAIIPLYESYYQTTVERVAARAALDRS